MWCPRVVCAGTALPCFSLWVVGSSSRLLHPWKSGGQIFEELLHIDSNFGAGLREHRAQFVSQLLAVFSSDLALLCQVNFVADDDQSDRVASYLASLLNPALDVIEGLARRDIVADHRHLRVVNVGWNQRPETFLARRVPQLQTYHFVVSVDRLRQKIDANCRLKNGHPSTRCLGNLPGTLHQSCPR